MVGVTAASLAFLRARQWSRILFASPQARQRQVVRLCPTPLNYAIEHAIELRGPDDFSKPPRPHPAE